MTTKLLLICSVLACTALAAAAITAERHAIIEAAAEEARNHAAAQEAAPKQSGPAAGLRAFKLASPEATREGNARLLFEEMVRRAEKKLFKIERESMHATSAEARAEELARELLHHPGSKLHNDELARLFQLAGCEEVLDDEEEIDCLSDPDLWRHRSITGVCNNLEHPVFGAAGRTFRRLIGPEYEDGVSQLRGTMQGLQTDLFFQGQFGPPNPSARLVSETVVRDRPDEQDGIAHITMQWGQWIDHDLDEAPAFGDCPITGSCDTDPERCVPVPIPDDDPIFGDQLVCHPFGRSLPACEEPKGGVVPPRQQINELTSFIDGSQVYGSREEVFNAVRDDMDRSLLRTGPNIPASGGASLPITCLPGGNECLVGCPNPTLLPGCFLGGDVRVNEQTSLTVFHTIWLREHNRIATILSQMNPGWTPDEVFFTTREIVGAEIQKITYKDYLANTILGSWLFDQLLMSYEDAGGYNPEIDAAVPNSFAAAALRFGHSQIRPVFDRLDENYQSIPAGPLDLVDMFFQPPSYAASGGTDPILRGLLTTQARRVDEFLNFFLTTRLFDFGNGGFDLATLNIQRGRDHGLPPYTAWKRWALRECNVSSNFRNELTEIRLLQLYGNLETVDLFVGGLAEDNLPGALVGATIACIFARTFGPIRNGDRFYYENTADGGFFSEAQRDEIEKTSLSRIICDNADNIDRIQPDAFRVPTSYADYVNCSDLPAVDLSVFSDGQADTRCAIRVRATNGRSDPVTFTSTSRVGGVDVDMSEVTVQPGSNEVGICLPFVCPTVVDPYVRLTVLGPMGCPEDASMRNPNLPPDTANAMRRYRATLHLGDILETYGLYTDIHNCEAGSIDALVYDCSSMFLLQDIEDLADALEDALNDDDNGLDPAREAEEKQELISALESYIQEHANEDGGISNHEENEANLMSDLANALNEMEN